MAGYTLAVIGGSGLYNLAGLRGMEETHVSTPFGSPSDAIVRGKIGDTTLLFLSRHGRGHRIPPHEINYRANIAALKISGATHLVSISATGSMKEQIAPGDFVVVDQFLDWTKRRVSTFFDSGIAAHVPFGDPVCKDLSLAVAKAARGALGPAGKTHEGGTYICIDGPQFSSRAESQLYRSWGVSVIGMTGMPEAKLAREAELPYAMLALATDYDCWHESEADVSVEQVIKIVQANAAAAERAVVSLATSLPDPANSPAKRALSSAIMTAKEKLSPETRARLDWLIASHIR